MEGVELTGEKKEGKEISTRGADPNRTLVIQCVIWHCSGCEKDQFLHLHFGRQSEKKEEGYPTATCA
jgi:hypothetical protein